MKRLLPNLAAVALAACLRLAAGTVPDIPVTGFEDGIAPRIGGEGRQPGSRLDIAASPVHSGRHSARLHYVFAAGVVPRQYVEAHLTQRLAGNVRRISAWLYGDSSRQQLKMRVTDAGGEIFQLAYGLIDWNGWRQVTFDLTQKPEVSWGGDENRTIDMPIRGVSYLVDSPVEPFESDLYLDDVTYTAEGQALDFVSIAAAAPVPGNAFYGRSPEVRVTLTNALGEPVPAVPVALRIAADGGRVISELHRTVTLAGGASESIELHPEITDYGLYHAAVTLDEARQKRFAFSYLPEADTRDADPSSSFGVSMHFGHGGRGPLEDNLRLASDLGIRWVRDDGGWSSIEREKGVYAVPPTFDRFLRTSRSEWGCEPLIILDYSNALYEQERSVATEAGRQAFAAWAEFMARTYRETVTHWEVWNEANITGFWKPKPNPKDYALLLKAAYAAVKRGNPEAKVVAMATAGIDLSFIEAVLKEGTAGCFDAVSVHPYRYPKSPDAPETMVEHLQRLVDLLAKYGAANTPIFNTEVGWPNQEDPRGLPEQTSADYLARMYTALRSLPDVNATFWYDFQNDGLDRTYNENNFGLLHNDFTPKSPAVAYRMTSRALAGRTYLRELPLGPTAKGLVFSGPADERLVAAWATSGSPSIALRWEADAVRQTSAAGPIRNAPVEDGVLALSLTSTPVFLIGAGRVKAAPAPLAVTSAWGIPGGAAAALVTVANPWGTTRTGRLAIALPPGWIAKTEEPFTLRAGATRTQPVSLQIPASAPVGSETEFTLRWTDDAAGEVAHAVTAVRVVPAAAIRTQAARVADGIGVRVQGTSPLTEPPAVRALNISLPAAWGGKIRLPGTDVVWQPLGPEGSADALEAVPRQEFSVTTPLRRTSAFSAPVPIAVELVLANGAVVTTERDVSFWRVPRLSPAVDGEPADWAATGAVSVAAFDGPGKAKWNGPADCSLAAKATWDDQQLYLLVEVTDDKQAQPYRGAEVWQGDGVQLAVDRHRAGRPSEEPYVELGLTLTSGGTEVFRWTDPAGLLREARCAVKRTGRRTVYEAAIPWRVLGGCPEVGEVLGFALLVNDNDGDGREGWVPLFRGIGWRKDPEAFGALMF